MTVSCRVLMVYPKFIPNSFWNYTEACELVGARYPAAPLGLITVAAMLPKHWDIRLINRNTEPLTDEDLDWADLVMIGGMLNQQPDFMSILPIGTASRFVSVGPTSPPAHMFTLTLTSR
jgi:hypothetical protein